MGKNQNNKTKNAGKPAKDKITVPPGEGETVVVDRSELNKLLGRLDRLESTADKGRLGKYDARFFKRGPNLFTLSVFEDRIITGWRTLKNNSYKDPRSGAIVEDQQYEILFHNNTKEQVQGYLAFSDMRYNETVQAEEVSRETTEDGTTLKLKIVDPNSKFFEEELLLDIRFVN